MLSRLEKRNLRNGLLFISPWLFGFLTLQIYPIGYSFYLSLTDYNGFLKPVFIGLRNFTDIKADPVIIQTIGNTLYYIIYRRESCYPGLKNVI